MKNIINLIGVIMVITFFFSCGNPVVEIGNKTYQPKIVIEGYLYPESNVKDIKIYRNLPLNSMVTKDQIVLKTADVKLIDLNSNRTYNLAYNPDLSSFYYNGADLKIGYNQTYKITISAMVDGINLNASATTITPQKGFRINKELSSKGAFSFRQKNLSGQDSFLRYYLSTSPGIEFYAYGVEALEASKGNYILDNPIFSSEDTADFEKHLNDHKFNTGWEILGGKSSINSYLDISWMNIWFYGKYKIIFFAGDVNFKDYIQTHADVMEMDGNLHEPRLHIEGDGIGVFGSAITDTVYFEIKR